MSAPIERANSDRIRRRDSYRGLVQGSIAPSARLFAGSHTISDSSYSRTAPNPLQLEQAPRGLLKEKSAGVTDAAGVSQLLQAANSVNRSRPVWCNTNAIPSPSWKAVA